MRRKNITSEMMKDYITESLLILMETKPYSDITIGEITKKAGVNRSTYYRNFDSKEDIIKHFFIGIMDSYLKTIPDNIDMENYLTGMFHAFLDKKRQIMLIYQNNTAYILFDTLNSYFTERVSEKFSTNVFEEKFYLYYHTGGIFNTFLLWFSNDMSPSPEELAKLSVHITPANFRPVLI